MWRERPAEAARLGTWLGVVLILTLSLSGRWAYHAFPAARSLAARPALFTRAERATHLLAVRSAALLVVRAIPLSLGAAGGVTVLFSKNDTPP